MPIGRRTTAQRTQRSRSVARAAYTSPVRPTAIIWVRTSAARGFISRKVPFSCSPTGPVPIAIEIARVFSSLVGWQPSWILSFPHFSPTPATTQPVSILPHALVSSSVPRISPTHHLRMGRAEFFTVIGATIPRYTANHHRTSLVAMQWRTTTVRCAGGARSAASIDQSTRCYGVGATIAKTGRHGTFCADIADHHPHLNVCPHGCLRRATRHKRARHAVWRH